MKFREIFIESWSELEKLELTSSFKLFRGQSSVDWNIESSLQRNLDSNEDHALNTEHWLIYQFKRRAHHYIECPEDEDILSWLALMQHHGAPTRLVDFTYSFYVALFFAAVEAEGDCTVWCIDEGWLRSISRSLSDKYISTKFGTLRDDDYEKINLFAGEYLNKLLKVNKGLTDEFEGVLQGVVAIDPYKQGKRVAFQQGVFLVPLNIDIGFFENIEQSLSETNDSYNMSSGNRVRKIIFSKDMKYEILLNLKAMNITYETLFPGIDGFSKSLVHTVLKT